MFQLAPRVVGSHPSNNNNNSNSSARGAPLETRTTYLDVAVDCAQSVFRSRIVSAPSDKQGVVFFGTREKRGLDDDNGGLSVRDGVFVSHRMNVPSARRIQDLVDLCGLEGNKRFKNTVGCGEDPSLFYDALLKGHHVAREMLNDHAAGARVTKRVLLFTNRDDPLKVRTRHFVL